MQFKASLWQQQTTKLSMTHELSQAIALLQYSVEELTAFLENKSLENPLIHLENVTVQPVNPLIDRQRRKPQKMEKNWIEQIADQSSSLEEQLISQIDMKFKSTVQIKIIRYLIQHLDENGYFTGDLHLIADKLSVSYEFVEAGLRLIQTLEPAGIGARSLQECLTLQIKKKDPDNKMALTILQGYFLQFAERKWKQISKELGVTLKEIQDVFDQIQLLNPKPGASLVKETAAYVVPDVIVDQTEAGLVIRLLDELLPKITFNDSYYKQFYNKDQQVNSFLQEKVQEYQWIVKSIEQRKETLLRVVMKIVEKQPGFFQKGATFLVPMTMKEIATDLDIHESTVSRTVREKYVQTPTGTYPLKTFFTSTIQSVDQEDSISSTHVKNLIRQIIDNENKEKPMSDQDIMEKLKEEQRMDVSRRTVAKYREQLGIPSSSKRKRFK
ncbi:RNA polymerase factor sigma-54 [Neobacillus dielmonensis]|uniref:RNA polymerase factor sigma-54 n=1 Tax=Neobacillus dielmonensis TaxID=1347369 RepID=UPI0005A76BDF|nr:RNA polymerase factor sigma-54 [Neobacillus dielmonensis]